MLLMISLMPGLRFECVWREREFGMLNENTQGGSNDTGTVSHSHRCPTHGCYHHDIVISVLPLAKMLDMNVGWNVFLCHIGDYFD